MLPWLFFFPRISVSLAFASCFVSPRCREALPLPLNWKSTALLCVCYTTCTGRLALLCAGLSFLARGLNLCFLQSVHPNLEKQVILFGLAGLAAQGSCAVCPGFVLSLLLVCRDSWISMLLHFGWFLGPRDFYGLIWDRKELLMGKPYWEDYYFLRKKKKSQKQMPDFVCLWVTYIHFINM